MKGALVSVEALEKEIVLPGLVDPHVHLRDPGYTSAEDFDTGTRAALAGGVVTVFDMPNNRGAPTHTLERLDEKLWTAGQKARTNIGLYFGAPPDERLEIGSSEYQQLTELFAAAGKLTFGLKQYWDITEGSEQKHGADAYRPVTAAWLEANPGGLIIAHTEGREAMAEALDLVAHEYGGRIHIPHISKRDELEEVIKAKNDERFTGTVTTGVCPHHLFLTKDVTRSLGWYGRMKPSLGTANDRDFLRSHIEWIDVIETDHAPHPIAEKERAQQFNPGGEVGTSKPTCFGVPGLETMLPLLLRGEQEGWISRRQIIERTSENPARMVGIEPPDSEVHVTTDRYLFSQDMIQSKCGWSPYKGMEMVGRVGTVVLNGVTKVSSGEVIAEPGTGTVIVPQRGEIHG
jgi:dihydroorotase-like cyclic amidohydrolase